MGFAVATTFVACETQTTTQHTTTATAVRSTTVAHETMTVPAVTSARPKQPWSRGTQTGTNL